MVLVPAGVCARVGARAGLLVAAWTAVLVAGSIAVPLVPGPRGDAASFWLLGSALLTLVAAAWWRDQQPEMVEWVDGGLGSTGRVAVDSDVTRAPTRAGQGCEELLVGAGARAGLCAGSSPAQVAAHIRARGALRVLVGELQGELAAVESDRGAVVDAFRRAGRRRDVTLSGVASAVDAAMRGAAQRGHLSAVLIEASEDGQVRLLGCGGPPAVFGSADGMADGAVRQLPLGGWPLGCAGPGGLRSLGGAEVVSVPGPGLLAVVSDAVPRAFLCSGVSDRALVLATAELLQGRGGRVEPVTAALVLAHLADEGGEGDEDSGAAVLVLAVPPARTGAKDRFLYIG